MKSTERWPSYHPLAAPPLIAGCLSSCKPTQLLPNNEVTLAITRSLAGSHPLHRDRKTPRRVIHHKPVPRRIASEGSNGSITISLKNGWLTADFRCRGSSRRSPRTATEPYLELNRPDQRSSNLGKISSGNPPVSVKVRICEAVSVSANSRMVVCRELFSSAGRRSIGSEHFTTDAPIPSEPQDRSDNSVIMPESVRNRGTRDPGKLCGPPR